MGWAVPGVPGAPRTPSSRSVKCRQGLWEQGGDQWDRGSSVPQAAGEEHPWLQAAHTTPWRAPAPPQAAASWAEVGANCPASACLGTVEQRPCLVTLPSAILTGPCPALLEPSSEPEPCCRTCTLQSGLQSADRAPCNGRKELATPPTPSSPSNHTPRHPHPTTHPIEQDLAGCSHNHLPSHQPQGCT